MNNGRGVGCPPLINSLVSALHRVSTVSICPDLSPARKEDIAEERGGEEGRWGVTSDCDSLLLVARAWLLPAVLALLFLDSSESIQVGPS